MERRIMLASAIVVLVSTAISYRVISSPTFTDQHSDIYSGWWGGFEIRKFGSSWSTMKGTRLEIGPFYTAHDVTITFSGEFMIFYEPPPDAPLPTMAILIKCIIQEYRGPTLGWGYYKTAKPWPYVEVLTETLDPNYDHWDSRSFTFIQNDVPGADAGIRYRVIFLWRLEYVHEGWESAEANVRRRTVVVTVNTQGH